jgi:hypothetical protein
LNWDTKQTKQVGSKGNYGVIMCGVENENSFVHKENKKGRLAFK